MTKPMTRPTTMALVTMSLAATLLLSGLLFLSSVQATTYAPLALEEMLARSDLAFYGTVTDLTTQEREGNLWTVVTFSVTEALKGELEESHTLSFYGGQGAEGVAQTVTGMPQFALQDSVIVLAYSAPYYSPIVGFNQGLWRLGVRGFEDAQGRLLSLSETGELLLEGEGAGNEAILAALRTQLGGQ